MLFNSIAFALFLPIVFVLYWFVFNKNIKIQNFFIVIVSYIFYGWWDWRFLLLMSFTTLLSWLSGYYVFYFDKKNKLNFARLISAFNIIINLLILGFFKYFDFFVESFVEMFSYFNITLQPTTLRIILPVGISFYTFQALSYSIDVYRKKLEPAHDIISFFAYVSFFPQLVAGPIERATNLLPQFYVKRYFKYDFAADGMRQILWGLFKKVIVADNCAIYANKVFENYQNLSGSELLVGAIFFAFQIYGDFSGYSDIAIGTSRLFGISLNRNFAFPYFSRDIAEFWRRWHISLSTWFRDYLYIPLGGSKSGRSKAFRNTFIIFTVSGLWHGANWTFVIWGVYHAILFLPLLLLKRNRIHNDIVAQHNLLPNIKELTQMVLTFALVTLGWIFFRSDTILSSLEYLQNIFSVSLFSFPDVPAKSLIFISIMLLTEWFQRAKQHGLDIAHLSKVFRWSIYVVIFMVIYLFHTDSAAFIYFQF